LYDKIFGKNTEYFILDRKREGQKNLLKNVFGLTDVDEVFDKEVDDKRTTKMTKIFFNHSDDEKKSLFSNSNE
jgi:hypothetical protein